MIKGKMVTLLFYVFVMVIHPNFFTFIWVWDLSCKGKKEKKKKKHFQALKIWALFVGNEG